MAEQKNPGMLTSEELNNDQVAGLRVRGIKLHFRKDSEWNEHASFRIKGTLIQDGLTNQPLTDNLKDVSDFLRGSNGYFAMVGATRKGTTLAVDRVRSIPLFYAMNDGQCYASDDPYWIMNELGEAQLEEKFILESILTGYVTGSNTLHPKIMQVRAGEVVRINEDDESNPLQHSQYYEFLHHRPYDKSVDLITALDEVLVHTFKRLISVAGNNTIVVPLSGGKDSRLIVLMLKRLGCKNLMAFSYGIPGNKQSAFSKEVAQSLGIPWKFVEYSNDDWSRWYNSKECLEYMDFSHSLCSFPHYQDWPAIWNLKNSGEIPEGSIIVPGHSGHCSGSHIPMAFGEGKNISHDEFVDYMSRSHYSLWKDLAQDPEIMRLTHERIGETFPEFTSISGEEAANLQEWWEWKERQPKFVINSVRVYEFWGFGWWLPLWDREYMDFWRGVGLQDRYKQKLYREFIKRLQIRMIGKNLGVADQSQTSTYLGKALTAVGLNTMVTKRLQGRKKISPQSVYDDHPLAMWGVIQRDVFEKLFTGKETLNAFGELDSLLKLYPDSDSVRKVTNRFFSKAYGSVEDKPPSVVNRDSNDKEMTLTI